MLVDSNKKQIKDEAILMIAAQKEMPKLSALQAFAALVNEMNEYGVTCYRAGNTIFVMRHTHGRSGTLHVLNADTRLNNNFEEWKQAAYKIGFDKMTFNGKVLTLGPERAK